MNKKFLILALCIIGAFQSNAQSTMNMGGWSTGNSSRYTRITGTGNLDQKIYQIECTTMLDGVALQFNVIVDGVTLPVTFHEGSYVAVEGKSIALQQVNPGKMIKGTWKIIQQPDLLATTLPWSFFPAINSDMLVANLKTEQEFLLSINYTSTNCTNTSFTVIIDGQPVKDAANNTLVFWEGSTIYGKGKSILIRASGTCSNVNATVNGDLKLRKIY
jgi:archaellum component FlaG (FlaF/FlaG flagellin family)